jgi:hypothetical protein
MRLKVSLIVFSLLAPLVHAEIEPAEKAKIEFLLQAISESNLTLTRNDQRHTAVEASEHIRAKLKSGAKAL